MMKRWLTRFAYSTSKSRMIELVYTTTTKVEHSTVPLVASTSPKVTPTTPKNVGSSIPVTPRTPLVSVMAGADEEDDDDVYTAENAETSKRGKKWKFVLFSEWTACVCIMGFLISSLTIEVLKHQKSWRMEYRKWSVLVMVIFCDRLFTEWLIIMVAFLIERKFLLKKKVLYFVYALKRLVQVFIYLGSVLLAWGLLFSRGVERSKHTAKIINYIIPDLGCCLLGAFIWLLKTLCVKLLAYSFQCSRFFDRIQECIFHQYVLQTLSGPPLIEME